MHSLFGARVSSNSRLMLRYCEEARAKAARFDPNDAWQGLVMLCLGDVERVQKNKDAACAYYTRAAAFFAKARPAKYEAAWVEEGVKDLREEITALGCVSN